MHNVKNCRRKGDRRLKPEHPLADLLAGAVERNELAILFQPQFACADGAIIGAEALARWKPEERGVLTGDELFAIAGQITLSCRLSQYIFDAALREACEWPEAMRLSLNITADDLAAPEFVERMTASLAQSGFTPERLTLEITEQALVSELEQSAERLQKLVDLGVRIALDDFGAGFCNFRYLKALPLHYLKLDRSMVEGIGTDMRDLEVLRGIIAMSCALDLDVVAEGVETRMQRDAVTREGCAYWQGFLGAKPMTASEFQGFASAKPLFFPPS